MIEHLQFVTRPDTVPIEGVVLAYRGMKETNVEELLIQWTLKVQSDIDHFGPTSTDWHTVSVDYFRERREVFLVS